MGQMRPSANYRLLRPEESAAVAELAKQVFDEFVAPLYSTEGIAEFHRYSDPAEFDARNRADHDTDGPRVDMSRMRLLGGSRKREVGG